MGRAAVLSHRLRPGVNVAMTVDVKGPSA